MSTSVTSTANSLIVRAGLVQMCTTKSVERDRAFTVRPAKSQLKAAS